MTDRSSSSTRLRLFGAALAAILIVQLFAVLVSGVVARDNSIAVASDAIRREGDTTVESILRHLDPAEQSVDVTSRLLADGLLDTDDDALARYLHAQLVAMPQMTGAFVGYPDGGFVFVSTEGDGFRSKMVTIDDAGGRDVLIVHHDADFDAVSTEHPLDDDFDPRERPWYGAAVEQPGVSWTDPYVFFTSGAPGVTASGAVVVDDEVTAVVGVDVELTGLSAFLDQLSISDSGEAFVVSGQTIVGAPSSYASLSTVGDDGVLRLSTTDELGLPDLSDSNEPLVQSVSGDAGTELVVLQAFPDDQGLEWSVLVRAPESEFTSIVSEQQRLTVMLTIGGMVLVIVGALVLWRLTRPIHQLEEWATTDPLTGLANRRHLEEVAQTRLDRLGSGRFLSVLVTDLDGFKQLNDTEGHHIGDRALTEIAHRLQALTSDGDIVARMGGDEFVIAREVDSVDEAVASAQRIVRVVGSWLRTEFPDSDLGITGGLSVSDDAGSDFGSLLIEADTALIAAKTEARGLVRLCERLIAAAL